MKNNSNINIYLATTIIILVVVLCLILTPNIAISWGIITFAGLYCVLQVWKQTANWWQSRHNKIARRERLLRMLASIMGLFLVTGSILFLYAFQCESTDSNSDSGKEFLFVNAEYLMRSIVCSLDLFMLDIDSNVLDQICNHQYLKGLISIQAVLSFSCTVAMLISLVYARVKAYYKLHKQTAINNEQCHLYVFFDMNEQSRLLAKSIHEKEREQAVIVIVEESPVDDDDKGGWNSIVGMFTHREQTFMEADEFDARVTFTETRLCDVDKDKLTKTDILGEINLHMLRTLIKQLANNVNDAQLHIFFLSENEDENIRSMSILAQDETINANVGNKNIKQRFYCHARRNGLNRVVEDVAVKRGLEVRIVDSAHLAIEMLKINEKYHPVRLVDIDKDNPTTVKSAFESLIIGFDEAGQDAMRFLYEFGAFVDSTATPENEKRSPFHCTAIDSNMDNLQGVFRTFVPAVINQRNQDGTPLVTLRKCNFQSEDFFTSVLFPVCQTLNYIVIAVGDDEKGMLLAVRIFNYIRQQREDLSHFRIFVRSYQSDKADYMQKIASHYNEGYNKDCGDKEFMKADEIIVLFGLKEDIYTYEMIVDEKLTNMGRRFQKYYAEMRGETEFWDDRRAVLLGTGKYEKDNFGNKTLVDVLREERKISIDDIRSLRRKESQDIANALHAKTKLYLLKQSMGFDFDWKHFCERYFIDENTPNSQGELDQITYPMLSQLENKAILNLARLEHLRWNASHEMLGYTKAPNGEHKCLERTRQHNCLRPWQELKKESEESSSPDWKADYISFDYGVVDISLLLYKDKLLSSLNQEQVY